MTTKAFIALSLLWFSSSAQTLLSLDEALKIGIENNFNVLIAKKEVDIAKSQNNWGNAGMAPQVGVNGGINYSIQNSLQEYVLGPSQNRNGAKSTSENISLNASWTLFDGLKMFATQKRLSTNTEISTITLQQQVEKTIYEISIAYFDLIKISQQIKANKTFLNITEEKERISKIRLETGAESKYENLLIQYEKNKLLTDIKRAELQFKTAQINFNKLLSRNAEIEFAVDDKISLNENINYEELKKNTQSNNLSLLAYRKNEYVQLMSINESKGNLYPVIQFNTSYRIYNAHSQSEFVTRTYQSGINMGLSLNWTLFNGFKNSNLVQERKLKYLNQQYLTKQLEIQTDAILYGHYQNYLKYKEIYDLEGQNIDLATTLSTITLERYKAGKTSILETKEIQRSLEESQLRFINALNEVKKAEIELLKLSNQLIKKEQ